MRERRPTHTRLSIALDPRPRAINCRRARTPCCLRASRAISRSRARKASRPLPAPRRGRYSLRISAPRSPTAGGGALGGASVWVKSNVCVTRTLRRCGTWTPGLALREAVEAGVEGGKIPPRALQAAVEPPRLARCQPPQAPPDRHRPRDIAGRPRDLPV